MAKKKLPAVVVKASKISGLGLFAGQSIPWGMEIIEYVGEKISVAETKRREKFYSHIGVNYVFQLSDTHDIDGLVGGNESRFINHKQQDFNCVPIRMNGRIYIFSYRDIDAGEELTLDYGFTP